MVENAKVEKFSNDTIWETFKKRGQFCDLWLKAVLPDMAILKGQKVQIRQFGSFSNSVV